MADRHGSISENGTPPRSLTYASSSPPPVDHGVLKHPSDPSAEDITPPTTRSRSSATLSNESGNISDPPISSSRASITERNTEWNAASPICLCQPDPKVPRPRNAFILYRQHHQANVVAQFPNLPNPEISKRIGDQWRASPPEEKAHWKDLAEQEKVLHQSKYPDYKYQPRRSGRNNSLSSATNPSVDSENRRCPKCGGRGMGTMWTASRAPTTPSSGSSAKRFLQGAGSPPPSGTGKGFHDNKDLSKNIIALSHATPRYKQPEDIEFPLSPDAKRRRVMGPPYAVIPRMANGPPTPFAFSRYQEPLPRPDFMNSPAFAMGPPPHPRPSYHQPKSSLTLPPLQKASSSSDVTQARSVEAMVMSIPITNKIKNLARISPPLADPSPASPAFKTRGFIIAIDGQETAAVEQITTYLSTVFSSSNAVKVFHSPITAAGSKESETEEKRTLSIERCHLNMGKYLALSSQLKSYITSFPLNNTSANASPAVSPKSIPVRPSRAVSSSIDVEMTDRTATRPAPITTSVSTTASSSSPIPIALVPAYQLTRTDLSACRVPIEDNYAPTDHWQWMASMWRGIVGPDITIAVQRYDSENSNLDSAVTAREWSTSKKSGEKSNRGSNGNGIAEVEVKLDECRAVVVRVETGGKVGEGGMRRLGFEIGEWIRGRGGL
ncbi:MAG: hypothetical protein LQ352_000970 [Teloschistes flavicans]|nr:MAG: hypothetical protein LQ352_000970 [Teloschistes flavicans]